MWLLQLSSSAGTGESRPSRPRPEEKLYRPSSRPGSSRRQGNLDLDTDVEVPQNGTTQQVHVLFPVVSGVFFLQKVILHFGLRANGEPMPVSTTDGEQSRLLAPGDPEGLVEEPSKRALGCVAAEISCLDGADDRGWPSSIQAELPLTISDPAPKLPALLFGDPEVSLAIAEAVSGTCHVSKVGHEYCGSGY